MATIPKLPLYATGPESQKAVLFVHGWPDDESVFEAQISHFAKSHRVYSVRLPWFSSRANAEADASSLAYSAWGYDFDILARALLDAIRACGATHTNPITVIAHDWGAVAALMAEIEEPSLFERLVVLDVGLVRWMLHGPSGRRGEVVMMLLIALVYMGVAASAFLLTLLPGRLADLGHFVASRVSRRMIGKGLWGRRNFSIRAAERPNLLEASPAYRGIHGKCCYPYFYLLLSYFRGLLGMGLSRGRRTLCPQGRTVKGAVSYPTCPVLFIYGDDKGGFKLHDVRWEHALRSRTDGSNVVAMPGAGHWLQVELPDETNTIIRDWLESSKST